MSGERKSILLVTSRPRRENFAQIEALDSLLPKDPNATLEETPFKGVFLVRTSLDADVAYRLLKSPTNPSIARVVPFLKLLENPSTEEIIRACVEVCNSIPEGTKVAVRCKLRKSPLSPGELEAKIGEALVQNLNLKIDLKSPERVVRVEGLGDVVGVGVLP